MSERPIILTSSLTRTILNRTKAQTRRLVKPQPPTQIYRDGEGRWRPTGTWGGEDWRAPAEPNDRLWVRETWAPCDCQQDFCNGFVHKADWIDPTMQTDRMLQAGNRWRSPIHMPKAAARLWLQVKSVRVERLQAITEGDAEAEGCGRPRRWRRWL